LLIIGVKTGVVGCSVRLVNVEVHSIAELGGVVSVVVDRPILSSGSTANSFGWIDWIGPVGVGSLVVVVEIISVEVTLGSQDVDSGSEAGIWVDISGTDMISVNVGARVDES
jgi:hypothetical protein